VEKSSSNKVKVLRTDNGGEYTSLEFTDYLKKEGIQHELSVPKIPEQNGVAKRMNRTLAETIRSMLPENSFLAEALSTAVYLRNRSPTVTVKNKTPYEAWFEEKPNVEHLHIFGCKAFAHIPKDECKKVDLKSRIIFLGYGSETKGTGFMMQKEETCSLVDM
jgi:hypothetical protein